MAVAAVVGYLAVGVLMRVVVAMRLTPFVVYCALLGVALIVFGARLEVQPATAAALALGVR
jgi:undecaprenyl pyrophosphate phosphatase UppP